jgi:hypothetical protein
MAKVAQTPAECEDARLTLVSLRTPKAIRLDLDGAERIGLYFVYRRSALSATHDQRLFAIGSSR